MRDYLLSAIICLYVLSTGLHAEECSQHVGAERNTFYVPEGGSLTLSCVVHHCGRNWTGSWMWKNTTCKKLIEKSDRYLLTKGMLSVNKTSLVLNLLGVSQSDGGSYGCMVTWGQGQTELGNLMYMNVTTDVPSQRKSLHRILVCGCACLCLPVIMGLVRCLSSRVTPQPFPRTHSAHVAVYRDQPHQSPEPPPRCPVPQKRSTFSHKAAPKSQQKTEVVYADISKDALKQGEANREPAQSTVYSSVKFS